MLVVAMRLAGQVPVVLPGVLLTPGGIVTMNGWFTLLAGVVPESGNVIVTVSTTHPPRPAWPG